MSDTSHTTSDLHGEHYGMPDWEQKLINVNAHAAQALAKVKAEVEQLKARVKAEEEAERRQAREKFEQLAAGTTVYVEYGNLLGVPDPEQVEALHSFLEQLGLRNMNIRYSTAAERVDFMLRQRYVAVNFSKGAFVSSTTHYGHAPVSQEEFVHAKRGAAAAKKFGF